MGRRVLLAGAAAIAMGIAGVAQAAAEADQTTTLPQLVVTARRVAEDVQKIPVAVTPVSGAELRQRTIRQLDDLVIASPGLNIGQVPADSSGASLVIRGQASPDVAITVDPSVGVYIDGVYMPRETALQFILRDANEIGQVEVLRGPQGTLFGRNTTGGALNISSVAPGPTLGGYVQEDVGNYGLTDTAAGLNLPLTDKAGLRLAYEHSQHDGYATNADGAPLENENLDFFHLRFTAHPTPRLSFDLSGDYLRVLEGESIVKFQGFNLASLAPNQPPAVQQTAQGIIAEVLAESGLDPTNPANFPVGIGILQSFAGGSLYKTGGAFDDTPGHSRLVNGSLTLAYEASDHLTLKSITGYVNARRTNALEFDGTPFNLLDVPYRTTSEFFSEEAQGIFRFGAVDGIVGGYYGREHGDEYSYATSLSALGNPPFIYDGIATNSAWAGYAQANWRATSRLTLTGGIRYTRDDRELDSLNHSGGPFQPGLVIPTDSESEFCLIDPSLLTNPAACEAILKTSSSAVTWLASADYKLADQTLIYAKASRGYRAGGENLRGSAAPTFAPFFPEYVLQYEAGLKSTFWDGHARVNADGYYTDYTDIQVTTLTNDPVTHLAFTTINNAAKARVWGAEFEGAVMPTRGLTLGITANYTDFKYTRYQSGNLDLTPTPQPIPKYTADLYGRYEAPLNFGTLSLQADWYWQDRSYSGLGDTTTPCVPSPECPPHTFDLTQAQYIRAVGELSARINLHVDRWGLDLALWGKNLTDERYINGLLAPFGGPPYFTIGFVSDPLTFGFEVRKSFGGR